MSLTNVFLCSTAGEWLPVIASCCLDRDLQYLKRAYEKDRTFLQRHLLYTPAKLDRLYARHNTRKGNSVTSYESQELFLFIGQQYSSFIDQELTEGFRRNESSLRGKLHENKNHCCLVKAFQRKDSPGPGVGDQTPYEVFPYICSRVALDIAMREVFLLQHTASNVGKIRFNEHSQNCFI